jgi:AcrR family transcriptional regulator
VAALPEHLTSAPVGREPLAREVMVEHQRDRVLAGAIGVFAKRGYPATTVDHIVAAAKVSVGNFYTLFDGKPDCFLAAFERIVAEGCAKVEARVPADAEQPQKVVFALRALLELLAAEPLRARVALVEAQTAGPEALARYQAAIDALAPALRRCRDASPVAAELPATLEVATLGGAVWFLQQRIVLGEIGDAAALLPDLVEIVLEPYLGREESERLLAAVSSS